MDSYEGLSDLLSNSVRYGLSNKRAIIIWGIIYLVTLALYIAGLAILLLYPKNTLAWATYFLTLVPLIAAAVLMPFAITPVYCAAIYILARFYGHATGRNARSPPPPAA